jgi:periplasmic divalent cation tolerance protein
VTEDDVCELVITAPDADWLIEFSRRLVADRLAASVHNLTTIRSIYRWQDEIHDRPEARAAVHTRTALVPRIIERLNAEHPYEVPGVFALPIVATSPRTELGCSTRPCSRDRHARPEWTGRDAEPLPGRHEYR